MRKRSLWSQHICCTLIRFPMLLRLKGKMRGMFPPAIPLAWLGVPLSNGSRVPVAEMQANESPLAKHMRAAWEASFTLNLLVSLKPLKKALFQQGPRLRCDAWMVHRGHSSGVCPPPVALSALSFSALSHASRGWRFVLINRDFFFFQVDFYICDILYKGN